MKRTTIKSNCLINQINISIIIIFIILIKYIENTIIPPPWSNPNINPCANLPGGWQLIYWKPLGKCFKIFTIGYPCPDTKELVPIEHTLKLMEINGINAECKCPPGKAELLDKCYKLFESEPCPVNNYFSPLSNNYETTKKNLNIKGICKPIKKCPDGMAYWPQDNKCLYIYTRGPCPKGKLLISENGLAKCKCENFGELAYYYHKNDQSCYEHYTRGPCEITGQLYLPNDKCDCKSNLPHYNFGSGHCYEFGVRGPCPAGNIYIISKNDKNIFKHGQCICKDNYVRWSDNNCYRLYTRGPCEYNEFIIDSKICIKNICTKGQLYYPKLKKCYHIGSQGPCNRDEVFIFDFRVRPSIDGLSFNGICGCSGIIKNLDQKCPNTFKNNVQIEGYDNCNLDGMGKINDICYKLYSRGPCSFNEWIEPNNYLDADAYCSSINQEEKYV